VKQWDSTVDARTRSTHVGLDGQLREIEQPFKSPTGATAMYPGGFGVAGEDINCRCVMLQRARWALDKSEIDKSVGDLSNATDEQLQAWADKLGVSVDELIKASNGIIEPDGTINHSIKAKNYNDFKKKYKTKEADETAKTKALLDNVAEEKKKFKNELWGGHIEDSAIDTFFNDEKVANTFPDYATKWKKLQKKEAELKSKLSSVPAVELKKQLKKAESEYNAILSKYKNEQALMLFGNADEIIKADNYKKQIKDLQGKLGIVPEPPKVEIPKVKPKTTFVDADFETFKKNAIGSSKFKYEYEVEEYHIKNNFVHERWEKQLSHDEKHGIKTYTSSAYKSINKDLRSGNLKNAKYKYDIEQATKGLEKCLLAEDTQVFRGMGGIDALSAWTGIPVNQLSNKSVQDSLVGSRLVEKGFMSTGIVSDAAWSGIRLEVYLPKGTKAMYVDPISHYRGEREIVVQRNSTFEVKEVKTNTAGEIKGLVLMLVEQKL
jgi:hypothetical protein